MTRLFSYTIPIDDGSAPNPFHGMCSLAICKPAIRRVAQHGDWVVGLGSCNAPSGDLSGHMVYAMLVQEVITLEDYDRRAPNEWPERRPNPLSYDLADRLGDCIYDYAGGSPPYQRPGVHGPGNIQRDLSGVNVLLSRDFYYFGSRAIPLPSYLRGLCHQGVGHKSDSNDHLVAPFEFWIRGLGLAPGQLYGWPDAMVDWRAAYNGCGCASRQDDDEGEMA